MRTIQRQSKFHSGSEQPRALLQSALSYSSLERDFCRRRQTRKRRWRRCLQVNGSALNWLATAGTRAVTPENCDSLTLHAMPYPATQQRKLAARFVLPEVDSRVGGIYDLKSARGTAHREQSEPRQEREFWDQRPRVEIAALPRTETEIGQTEVKKPRQWRAFLDRLRKMPKQRTGWWAYQGSNLGPAD
jgi:hypothetical protein